MSKLIFLYSILSFFPVVSIGQNCVYNEYYSHVELATKNYSEKEYKIAEVNFKKAFASVDFPLGKDLHLALSVAEKTENYDWAYCISIRLAKGGVPLRYFRYQKKYDWYEDFYSNYKTYSTYYKNHHNPELKEKFISLINRDRIFTQKTMNWYNGTLELTSEAATQEAIAILEQLQSLTEQYGFPSEQKMGYNYIRRIDKVQHYSSLALLIHIYKYGDRIYEDEIDNYICAGMLHPHSKEILKNSQGFSIEKGIEQEMKIRQAMFHKKQKN